MGCDALALVEDLDGRAGDAGIDDLADQLGRHRVIVAANLDVIVRRHAGPFPICVREGRHRQRTEGRTINRLQQFVSALAEPAHDLGVDRRHTLADRNVQLCQREEALIAQLGQHEALDNLHGHFDLGLRAA